MYVSAYSAKANLKKGLIGFRFVRCFPGSDFVQPFSSAARALRLRDFHSVLPQRL